MANVTIGGAQGTNTEEVDKVVKITFGTDKKQKSFERKDKDWDKDGMDHFDVNNVVDNEIIVDTVVPEEVVPEEPIVPDEPTV